MGGGCQKSGKIDDVVYGWSLSCQIDPFGQSFEKKHMFLFTMLRHQFEILKGKSSSGNIFSKCINVVWVQNAQNISRIFGNVNG